MGVHLLARLLPCRTVPRRVGLVLRCGDRLLDLTFPAILELIHSAPTFTLLPIGWTAGRDVQKWHLDPQGVKQVSSWPTSGAFVVL